MNLLAAEKEIQIISALIEGNSVRAAARLVGVEHKTVMRVLVRAGDTCARLLNQRVRRIWAKRIQMDEIWTFVFKKQARITTVDDEAVMGDQYVFVGMDSDTKLVISYLIGKRDATTAFHVVRDLQERLVHRVQLTTDGFRPYLAAVEDNFGADIDYAMLVKVFSGDETNRERYSPSDIVDSRPVPVMGTPDFRHISTSFVERQNLTIRMQLRRFTRLTNGFSKKLSHLKAALAIHFTWYNFVRVHQTLRVTPAMEAGIADRIWHVMDLLAV